MPATATATTAAGLLAAVAAYRPAVEGGALEFEIEPPPGLKRALRVLHTGVRAGLAGRAWFGCGSDRRTAASVVLNPAAPIPDEITLLAVEGDGRWDRIPAGARVDLPELFAR